MNQVFHPAYTIRYKENEDSVVVQSHGLNGEAHFGGPKHLTHANLPIFLFQLVDRGYSIQPGQNNGREGYREILAFSEEFHQMVVNAEAKRKTT